jgi:phage terminase large subunit
LFLCNNELYLKEYLYETGLTNQNIAERLKDLGVQKYDAIYCDSAEPKSIDEIHLLGFNAQGVVKGADSINYGIDLMKGFKLHIVTGSDNLEREMRKYKWAEDRTGTRLNKPVDVFNHAIDAARYVTIMTMGSQKEPIATIDVY